MVGVAGAVVLWITVGDSAQPATKDAPTAGGDDIDPADVGDETVAEADAPGPFDQDASDDEEAPGPAAEADPPLDTTLDTEAAHPFDQDAAIPVAAAVAAPPAAIIDTPAHATRPAEGTVPQAAPSRPADPAAVDRLPAAPHRTETLRGSYSFDPAPPLTAARRVRSALGVLLVVTAVGLALAASVGVLAVFVSRALEGAVN